jgi:toxin ParE1/3/4
MLVQNPLAGRERAELAQGLRSFAVANYVIFYFSQSGGVEIVHVMSGRQDITADDMN